MVNFDAIAPWYQALEYASFGPCLERCRNHFLPHLAGARRALVLGDGDGRFVVRLLGRHPQLQADVVDCSAGMLARLRRRAERAGVSARLSTRRHDARRFTPPRGDYDLVISHFFLDCLSGGELDSLVARITPALRPGGRWLLSEFAIPEAGLMRPLSGVIVGALYRAFGVLTGLRVRALPDYAASLGHGGWTPCATTVHLGGLLRSELWTIRA